MPALMHHVSVFVRDMERSLELFNGILGMDTVKRLGGVRGEGISTLVGISDFSADLAFLKHPGQKILLELVRQTGPPQAINPQCSMNGFGISLTVPDLDAVHASLSQAGWSPISEPLDMIDPSGSAIRLFCFHTDEGMMVELIQQAG
ncbi:MAG: VOC family protein [Desulfarculaceae bacterium]|nr:VOC family protein [Desulfarculaceae bacterium]MCF8047905.1 VOC family protein [Desulfarculaceae bacterium]MCF8064430.1 VOC family protein [Desulfarculaceae bacterium]MCF8097627.1 VOC family protein [Desulfarculaceae bacterium]MCF8122375.1 VOC family protein [Desulfarculaceae bacterium]